MSLAIALQKYTPEGVPNTAVIEGTPSGSYTAGGDTLNLTPNTWTDPNGKGLIGYPQNPPGECPKVTGYVGFTGAYEGAYAIVIPGTTLATYKLQQFLPGGTEFSTGAYNAAVTGGYWIIEVPI
jgi:hypothetical protein